MNHFNSENSCIGIKDEEGNIELLILKIIIIITNKKK